jgi:hypothetical protein
MKKSIVENLPAIGIGLAAVAIAGYVAFGGKKDSKTPVEEKTPKSPMKKGKLNDSQVV